MLYFEKPLEDGAMRLVRVHINGHAAIVTARISMAQKALIISSATYDRLVGKFGRGEIRTLDSRCSSDWRVLISVEKKKKQLTQTALAYRVNSTKQQKRRSIP